MFDISVEHHKIVVTKPASELIIKCWSTDVAPEMWARASTAPLSSISMCIYIYMLLDRRERASSLEGVGWSATLVVWSPGGS